MKPQILNLLRKIVYNKYLLKENLNFNVEIPKNKKFGDYSTNISMILASKLKKSPKI